MENKIRPLTIIYWTRVLLGVLAALICTFLSGLWSDFSILNGISIALLVYIITYYAYKARFLAKVEKPSKIFSTGVGAYFLAWIVTFAMLTTLTTPILTITSPAPNAVFSPGNTVTIEAKITIQFGTPFSRANVTTIGPANDTIPLAETSPGIYQATYKITASDPLGEWKITVAAEINGKHREASVNVHIQASS